ncbi:MULTISPECIES: electron transfer flavoprotein subunit alpha/FixB family protein [unclassified Spirosoma]|uniref:electron transfer flavoprotein subunit alpha/FixB family protein n=1 Tax=unclassified Spirosoma TaxID=2621999 RepID=UPI00095FF6D2|nr:MULTISPECIES: electron transfer flavoprotein subunit alpha/FixB family protein [unclassified Spirosoma]MBN8823711.1 electron transfer flavoprotein subunit alpha/FixB family protein [Spirosoma sp.]OJW76742.1 MAG: electron transfer flavoprotein subunit alpha [Spirosoma sp. 48-14]
MSVLIFAELDEGKIKKSAQEAIFYGARVAQMLGTSATAIVIGQSSDDELASAGRFGATNVLHASDAKLTEPNGMAYATVVAQAAQQEGSKVIVLAKSSLGDAMTARLAGKLKAGLAANVVELPDLSNGFRVKSSIYTGKAFAYNDLKADVKILAIKKNTITPEETEASASVKAFSPTLNDADFSISVKSTDKSSGDILLPEADLVVSAGRGLKGPENWGIVEDLAKSLHAATACSKPVSDLDWRPHSEHVGQTGLKISPNLYIACGISGAIQHLAGVNSSKVIVVINKDPDAPFFKSADYGIVGDVFDILPRLTKAVQAL